MDKEASHVRANASFISLDSACSGCGDAYGSGAVASKLELADQAVAKSS